MLFYINIAIILRKVNDFRKDLPEFEKPSEGFL
jgi:hypothetical protein